MSRAAGRDDPWAGATILTEGEAQGTAQTVCAYCGMRTPSPDRETPTPAVDDHAAWAEVAREHQPWCEWVVTRAWQWEEWLRLQPL